MATRQVPMLSLEAAKVAAEAAEKKAKEMSMGKAHSNPQTQCTYRLIAISQTST